MCAVLLTGAVGREEFCSRRSPPGDDAECGGGATSAAPASILVDCALNTGSPGEALTSAPDNYLTALAQLPAGQEGKPTRFGKPQAGKLPKTGSIDRRSQTLFPFWNNHFLLALFFRPRSKSFGSSMSLVSVRT